MSSPTGKPGTLAPAIDSGSMLDCHDCGCSARKLVSLAEDVVVAKPALIRLLLHHRLRGDEQIRPGVRARIRTRRSLTRDRVHGRRGNPIVRETAGR